MVQLMDARMEELKVLKVFETMEHLKGVHCDRIKPKLNAYLR